MQGLSRQEAMERRRQGSLKELHDKVASLKAQITALGTINRLPKTNTRRLWKNGTFTSASATI